MSRLRKVGLTIDDPLAPAEPRPQRAPQHERPPKPDAPRPSRAKPSPRRSERAPAAPRVDAWRSWSGLTRVASYRLPDELLAELASTSDRVRVQVGLLVTAAITRLLDEPDEVIGELVDRADDARIQGRRASRRGLVAAEAHPEPTSAPSATL
jgi:hypothetical protein